jgi:hypothetical protein
MAEKITYLRRTDLSTECDACGGRLDLMTGGVCERCRRILCARHLHGSWLRRMIHEFRRPVTCVDCRTGRTGA